MIGATLYLSGREADSGAYIHHSNSCSMCKRMVINAGISRVVIRDTDNDYRQIDVQEWIDNDESLHGERGYWQILKDIKGKFTQERPAVRGPFLCSTRHFRPHLAGRLCKKASTPSRRPQDKFIFIRAFYNSLRSDK